MNNEIAEAVREFEEGYAQRSGVTVQQLHGWGMYGAPCDCGSEGCTGFGMEHPGSDNELFGRDPDFFRSRYLV
jgi:hypothetical protein